MFAMLPADGSLNPHRDPFAGSLRYHLGLSTPNDDRCAIIVDDIPDSWRDGEDVVFDETCLHHAQNKTRQDRLILFERNRRPHGGPQWRVPLCVFGAPRGQAPDGMESQRLLRRQTGVVRRHRASDFLALTRHFTSFSTNGVASGRRYFFACG
ncbi:hypothetical protein PUN4_260054 [Paraburkholderia unamae]|nr:hypothetical protein PUN4_260054 [Paraburkholderia unamae]